ncbi:MAG: serine protease [Alphaproteobacteria bacterium]|nr:serine protease [Alphaproteobacteria bacterium]
MSSLRAGQFAVAAAALLVTTACAELSLPTPEPTLGPSASAVPSRAQAFEPGVITAARVAAGAGRAQGAWLGGGGATRCYLVTVAHAVDAARSASLAFENGASVDATILQSDPSVDLAVLRAEPSGSRAPPDCSPVTPTSDLETAIRSGAGVGYILSLDSTGAALQSPVFLRRRTDTHLAVSPAGGARLTRGLSGSPVLFNDMVVGILVGREGDADGLWRVTRLDYAQSVLPRYLTSAEASPPSEPFDLDLLPDDIRRIAVQARRTEQLAKTAEEDALEVRAKAREAKSIASSLPERQTVGGYRRFRSDSSDNYYWGQVRSYGPNNVRVKAFGFGVSETVVGEDRGNLHFCRFDSGCVGAGVLEYSENRGNSNDLLSWRGEFEDGARRGVGVLRWRKEDDHVIQRIAYLNIREGSKPAPGVWIRASDGYRFEGEIGANWDGLGVLWTADGSIQAIGRWADSEFIEDRTAEVQP